VHGRTGRHEHRNWSGVIPQYQQQRIISNSAMIIYDHQNRPDGPFEGQTQQTYGEDDVIQILT